MHGIRRICSFLFLLLVLVDYGSFSSPTGTNRRQTRPRNGVDYRLPNNSLPTSYLIKLIPYIEWNNFTFYGESKIDIQVLSPTSELILHTDALTYDEASTSLTSQDGANYTVSSHAYDTERQFLTIAFGINLSVGNYTLELKYNGILNSEMTGFYRSFYVDDDGDTIWFAATNFKPIFARKAFPCYDEPGLKATYDIWIKHDENFRALSNMPVVTTTLDPVDGKFWTVFDTVPLASSYSIAFVVSDFVSLQADDGSLFNVWSRPSIIAQARYALNASLLAVRNIEDYTNVPYVLPKLDQISFPNLLGGATENWGLLSYREIDLRYEEGETTTERKQTIATGISRKIAGQWFGGLVSHRWWTDTWVTEGFTTYFKYFTSYEGMEDWRLTEQFVVKVQQQVAFVDDASIDSHPLNRAVASPDEIVNNFDSIAIAKGAAVIRMMGGFVAQVNFRTAITSYLNTNAYGSITSDDLIKSMHDAAVAGWILPVHLDVNTIMSTWIEQMGYPLVTVLRNYTTGSTELRQERFLTGDPDPSDDHDYRWWIPVNWAVQSSQNFERTLPWDFIRSQDRSVMFNGFENSGWVILNVQQIGYYRVNYDETNWAMLTAYLNTDDYATIHAVNRAQLIDDSLNLAKADYLSYSIALDVTTYLHQEVDYVPWYSAFAGLDDLDRRLANTATHESLRTYLAILTSKIFDTHGVEENDDDDDHTTRLNRINVIEHACAYGERNCRLATHEMLVAWLDAPEFNAPPVNLRRSVLCAGIRSADAMTWMRLWEYYLSSHESFANDDVLAALGCTENARIVDAYMQLIIAPESGMLSRDDSSVAFSYLIRRSPYNVDRTFEFIATNFDYVAEYFGEISTIEMFLTDIGHRMTTQAQLDRLIAFSEAHPTISVEDVIRCVSSNVKWALKYEPQIYEWMIKYLSNGDTTTSTEPESNPPNDIETTTTTATTPEGSGATISSSLSSLLVTFLCGILFKHARDQLA